MNQDVLQREHSLREFFGAMRWIVRSALYMAGIVAMRHHPIIRTCYERLVQAGKPKKVAIVACMRKLLITMNAMVRDNLPWQLLKKTQLLE